MEGYAVSLLYGAGVPPLLVWQGNGLSWCSCWRAKSENYWVVPNLWDFVSNKRLDSHRRTIESVINLRGGDCIHPLTYVCIVLQGHWCKRRLFTPATKLAGWSIYYYCWAQPDDGGGCGGESSQFNGTSSVIYTNEGNCRLRYREDDSSRGKAPYRLLVWSSIHIAASLASFLLSRHVAYQNIFHEKTVCKLNHVIRRSGVVISLAS